INVSGLTFKYIVSNISNREKVKVEYETYNYDLLEETYDSTIVTYYFNRTLVNPNGTLNNVFNYSYFVGSFRLYDPLSDNATASFKFDYSPYEVYDRYPVTANNSYYPIGISGNMSYYNGNANHTNVSSALAKTSTGDYCFNMWLNTTQTDRRMFLSGQTDVNNFFQIQFNWYNNVNYRNYICMDLRSGGTYSLNCDSTTGLAVNGTAHGLNFTNGSMFMMTFVFNNSGQNAYMYINGVLRSNRTGLTAQAFPTAPIRFGQERSVSSGIGHIGGIDEATIYKGYACSQSDITQMYENKTFPFSSVDPIQIIHKLSAAPSNYSLTNGDNNFWYEYSTTVLGSTLLNLTANTTSGCTAGNTKGSYTVGGTCSGNPEISNRTDIASIQTFLYWHPGNSNDGYIRYRVNRTAAHTVNVTFKGHDGLASGDGIEVGVLLPNGSWFNRTNLTTNGQSVNFVFTNNYTEGDSIRFRVSLKGTSSFDSSGILLYINSSYTPSTETPGNISIVPISESNLTTRFITNNFIFINVSTSFTNISNITIRLYNTTGLYNTSINGSNVNFSINFTGLPADTYSFNASAYNTSGLINSTETRIVYIYNNTINISTISNTTVGGIINISFNKSSYPNVGVNQSVNISLMNNSGLQQVLSTNNPNSSFLWNTSGYSSGNYYIRIHSNDSNGNIVSKDSNNFTLINPCIVTRGPWNISLWLMPNISWNEKGILNGSYRYWSYYVNGSNIRLRNDTGTYSITTADGNNCTATFVLYQNLTGNNTNRIWLNVSTIGQSYLINGTGNISIIVTNNTKINVSLNINNIFTRWYIANNTAYYLNNTDLNINMTVV
ncbi:MAG TPA: hypothetical protein V6C58_25525, partial [Allocoleopsis sp.]